MSKVTNLSRFRKQKARGAKRAAAEANAVKFGRSKARKNLDRALREKAARDLDGHETK